MDKELIVRIINDYYSNGPTMDNVARIIGIYCKDRGKKEEDIIKLIQLLAFLPEYDMVKDAISWYARKLNLTIINKIDNNRLIPFKIL